MPIMHMPFYHLLNAEKLKSFYKDHLKSNPEDPHISDEAIDLIVKLINNNKDKVETTHSVIW